MITEDSVVPLALGLVAALLAVVLVAFLVIWRRERARSREQLAATAAEAAELRARVDALARQVEVRETPQEFLITRMDDPDERGEATLPERHIDGRLFADLVLRETVLKAAALTHGVRRALAPETRNRIRFEMKREVKRSRKARRIEMREVRREMADRKRAAREGEAA
ncbi:hypothetical protein [Nocardioides sp. AE5]|uniref:hypothetical protein n=1 Tax=Nocardioides sp. AE5 TaxID=2962573 RepID=UPI002882A1CF|nr:hypothetical protein [Nocardioides sp. AE5]MDT0201473.1 hypothetical protein [Nocardioides sp. AE5]